MLNTMSGLMFSAILAAEKQTLMLSQRKIMTKSLDHEM